VIIVHFINYMFDRLKVNAYMYFCETFSKYYSVIYTTFPLEQNKIKNKPSKNKIIKTIPVN